MFQNPFSFKGRIRRTEYGVSFILYVILAVIINLITEDNPDSGVALLFLAYIPMLWVFWAQGAKRCHDLDKSGWWQIIPFYVFWMLFQAGNPMLNAYGNNPKNI